MDFNNLPETRFEDVKQVLRVASEHIAARLQSNNDPSRGNNGFSGLALTVT